MNPVTLNRLIGLTLLIGLVAAAAVIPFDQRAPTCPLFNLTGFPCPLCKMTSAWSLSLRGEVTEAIAVNPFGVFFLLITLGGIVYFPAALALGRPPLPWSQWRRQHPWPLRLFLVAWLFNWAYVAWRLLQ